MPTCRIATLTVLASLALVASACAQAPGEPAAPVDPATAAPADAVATAPVPQPTTAAAPQQQAPETITFAAGGTSAERSGQLDAGGMHSYLLNVQAGQTLEVNTTADPGPVAVVVYGADGTVLQSPMGDAPSFRGAVPSTQDYQIDLKAGPGATAYVMTVTVPPLAPESSAAQRVSFGPGGTEASAAGQLAAGTSAKYVLSLVAGKTFIVQTTGAPDPVAISVYGADGTVLQSPMGSLPGFEGQIPSTQDYFVDVIAGGGPTAYTVTFTAPAE